MSKVLGEIVSVIGVLTGQTWLIWVGRGISAYQQRRAAKKAKRRAIAEYNASLEDRLQMVDITAAAPRTLAMGRVRCVEGVRRRWTSGTNDERLTMVISFAGHQIDGFETFYFDDTALELDEDGYVQSEPWLKTRRKTLRTTATADGAGAATVTLPAVPVTDSVSASFVSGAFDNQTFGQCTVSVAGAVLTISGADAGATISVVYETDESSPLARIRWWTGASGQNVGADLAAEYPGKISATDRFESMAVAVVDLTYDPDVFPQGYPNVTVLLRGARVYDPRLDSTQPGGSGAHRLADESTWEWSENPALHAYHFARWANGWAVPAAEIRTADIMAAADVCDVSTTFTLVKADTSTEDVTLPRYRSGITISSADDPRASMDEIIEAMAGRDGWAGGQWRLRAGAMATPAFSMTADWIASLEQADGALDTSPVVRIVSGVARADRVNRVNGSCVDPAQRYQVLPFPGVEDPVRIAARGEFPAEVEYQAVNHVAHAQHLASILIRQTHAGLTMQARCNLSAWDVELFDVGQVTLPRYGIADKTFEVTAWQWHPSEGVQLQLEEITDEIYEPDAELAGRDPAPNSTLRRPWDVERMLSLSVTSGTDTLTDGSVITRTRVTWTPATGQNILVGGQVEIQYTEATSDLPTADWATWTEQGAAVDAIIPGLRTERVYRFRARFVQLAPRVAGDWSTGLSHQVAVPPLGTGYWVEFRDDDGVAYTNEA